GGGGDDDMRVDPCRWAGRFGGWGGCCWFGGQGVEGLIPVWAVSDQVLVPEVIDFVQSFLAIGPCIAAEFLGFLDAGFDAVGVPSEFADDAADVFVLLREVFYPPKENVQFGGEGVYDRVHLCGRSRG